MATFIKNNCACCPPTPCDGCEPCNLFPASAFQKYLDHAENLPPQIYFGGTRQFNDSQYVSALAGGPPLDVKTWGGVTGGTLVSRSGLGYGNTTNGVILEPLDPDFPSNGYTWAVYKDGQRSVADYLIDGTTRHDNFASTYAVNKLSLTIPEEIGGGSTPAVNYTVTRVSCGTWKELVWHHYPDRQFVEYSTDWEYLQENQDPNMPPFVSPWDEYPDLRLGCETKPSWIVFPSGSRTLRLPMNNAPFYTDGSGVAVGTGYSLELRKNGPGTWVPESTVDWGDGTIEIIPAHCEDGPDYFSGPPCCRCECNQVSYEVLWAHRDDFYHGAFPSADNYLGDGIAGNYVQEAGLGIAYTVN